VGETEFEAVRGRTRKKAKPMQKIEKKISMMNKKERARILLGL
jgi:hypothetical protein